MIDHEQQAIESLAKEIYRISHGKYRPNFLGNWNDKNFDRFDKSVAYLQAETAMAFIKSSGYQHVQEGFVVVPKEAAYVYDPENWEFTHENSDLDLLLDGADQQVIHKFSRLAKLPDKWAAKVGGFWQEFDTEEQATAAMVKASKDDE